MAIVFGKKRRGLGQLRRFRASQFFNYQSGRNIYAIQNVTDVVQHAGCDFRHAGETRCFEQLLLRLTQRLLRLPPLRHIAHDVREKFQTAVQTSWAMSTCET